MILSHLVNYDYGDYGDYEICQNLHLAMYLRSVFLQQYDSIFPVAPFTCTFLVKFSKWFVAKRQDTWFRNARGLYPPPPVFCVMKNALTSEG